MGRTKKFPVFLLLKWSNEYNWDVIDADLCFKDNEILKKKVLEEPSSYIGVTMDMFWGEKEEKAPAKILAIGKEKDIEQKRTAAVDQHYQSIGEEIPDETRRSKSQVNNLMNNLNNNQYLPIGMASCMVQKFDYYSKKQLELMGDVEALTPTENNCMGDCQKARSYKERYRNMKEENKLKDQKIKELEAGKSLYEELSELVKKLKRDNTKYLPNQITTSDSSNASVSDQDQQHKVDLGKDVFIDKGDLNLILSTSSNGTVLARSLPMKLFTVEEIKGSSLSGRACNAALHLKPKRALDRTKIEAIIAYSLRKYLNTMRRVITESLANKIKEVTNFGLKKNNSNPQRN